MVCKNSSWPQSYAQCAGHSSFTLIRFLLQRFLSFFLTWIGCKAPIISCLWLLGVRSGESPSWVKFEALAFTRRLTKNSDSISLQIYMVDFGTQEHHNYVEHFISHANWVVGIECSTTNQKKMSKFGPAGTVWLPLSAPQEEHESKELLNNITVLFICGASKITFSLLGWWCFGVHELFSRCVDGRLYARGVDIILCGKDVKYIETQGFQVQHMLNPNLQMYVVSNPTRLSSMGFSLRS